MRYMWRLQFGLRTLLLAMLVLGTAPWIVCRFVQWRQDKLWNALETGKHRRDEALVQWRQTYDSWQQGAANSSDEAAVRERYFVARKQVEDALSGIISYYGDQEEAQKRGVEWREKQRAMKSK